MDKNMEERGPAGTDTPRFEILTSRQFTAWMAEHGVSIAFTTYQVGSFLLGLNPDGSWLNDRYNTTGAQSSTESSRS